MEKTIKYILGLALTLFLCSSCTSISSSGDSDDTITTTTVIGNVAKGSVSTAIVNFYILNADGTKGDFLANAITDSDGGFQVIWEVISNPIFAEASGGSYVNEVTLATDTLASSDKMTAVIPPLSEGYANATITPLTHMAATRALVLVAEGIPLATAIDAANIGIAQQYNLPDILETLPADAGNSEQVKIAVRDQRLYGLVLAGIAQEANDLGVRPIDLAYALATDIEDGVLDGLGDNAITMPGINGPVVTLSPTAGLNDLQNAIKKFMESGNNVTNLVGMNISTAPVIINPAGTSFYITAAPLPAWIEGQVGTAMLTVNGGTPPYTWSTLPGALPSWLTLTADGRLTGTPPLLAPGSTASISPAFPITCRDSNGLTQTISLTVTVVRAGPALGWFTFPNPQVNASFDQQIATGTGGAGPYYCKLDTMGGFPPLGLILTPDCHLKGTPSAAGGPTIFRVCVIDMVGASSCGNVGVTVATSGGGGGGGGGNGGEGSPCDGTSDCQTGLICHSPRNCIVSSMGNPCDCSSTSVAGECAAAPSWITSCANLGESCGASCCAGLSCNNGECEDPISGRCPL